MSVVIGLLVWAVVAATVWWLVFELVRSKGRMS